MRATSGGLLLLKLVAGRLTSCVNGPGWTPYAYDIGRNSSGDGPGARIETAAAPKCILRVPLVILKSARAGSTKLVRDLGAVTGCPTRHEMAQASGL